MIVGYEAAGRIGEARQGGRGGVHASQIVAFGGAVTAAKLLKLTDEQMAHALGIAAITMGGLATGTNSWAREQWVPMRPSARSTRRWPPAADTRSTRTCSEWPGDSSRFSEAVRTPSSA